MTDYTAGYTSALNSQSNRQAQQTEIQRALQAMAAQQWQQQQIMQQQDQAKQAQAKAGDVLSTMYGNPPPGPQSPPPGASSQPMQQPPPPQPQPPPQAMAPGMGGGTAANFAPPPGGGGMPPGMMPPPMAGGGPPPPPQGWKPSPGAPSALGGGQPPPAPPGGAAAPAGGLPPPPPMGGAQGQPQPGAQGAQGGVIPPQMLSVPNAIQTMKKMGVPPEKMVQVLEQMMPAINGANKEALENLKMQTELQSATIKFQTEKLAELKAQQQAKHQDAQEDAANRRIDVSERRATDSEQRTAGMMAKLAAGTGGGGTTSKDDLISAGAQIKAGEPITQVVPGYGKDAVATRAKARSEAIRQIREENPDMSAADAGRALAQASVDYAAGKSSTTQLNKMLGATEQAVNQLDFNIDKTKEAIKGVKSSDLSPVINAIMRQEEHWTGDPKLAPLFFYMNATAMESARILQGGQASAAQLHQGAADEAKKWANANMTPASFDQVAKAMHDEGQARLRTYKQAKEQQSVGGGKKSDESTTPNTNAKGWTLHTDKNGNKAYVSPDGKQFDEVK